MDNHLPKVKKQKKKKSLTLDELLDQIERLKLAIERIQSGYKIYRQLRSQTLGKYFFEWRILLLKQMQALDHLHQHSLATKALKKDISTEFRSVYEHFEYNFTFTEEESLTWKSIILYHTGINIISDEIEPLQDEIDDTKENIDNHRSSILSTDKEKKTIRSIYKDLMKHYHPDRNPDPQANEIAQQITVSYEQGDLEQLLTVYKRTFSSVNTLEEQEGLNIRLEEELELLLAQHDEMTKQLGADQNMTEKSAKKRVKAEAKQFREYITYQTQLLQLIYCDVDLFKDFVKQR